MKKIFTVLFMTLILAGSASAQEKRFAMSSPRAIESLKFEADAFASELQKALTNNGFRVVARGQAVDAIVKDFDFESNSGLTDNEKAKLAQITNADYICMSSVTEKNGIYYFSATVIDKELGENVAMVSAFLKNFGDIDSACEQMAGDILNYLGASSDNSYTRSQSSNYEGGSSANSTTSNSTSGSSYCNQDSTTLTCTINGVDFKMIKVEGGTFAMGEGKKKSHEVTLSDYYIGEFEVTQELWEAVMGKNPSKFKGGNLPVERVSWKDCQKFINELNQLCAGWLNGKRFSLPTEAQWEYAARGGNKSREYEFSGSNDVDEVAWYNGNSDNIHSVGTKSPNELGIYDMSGNVYEWCQDWKGSYSSKSRTDPQGPSSGSYRVLRGGSWDGSARLCRVYDRDGISPFRRNFSHGFIGFRLALVL
ncbi:MAG: SUMF1/EgtB/PvdO family nonheme iron enzyme [Bacteroidales bacterium]|nr:SUMF1/EgtB/PvdO family nonheme iron enzyme [Bacteroidales bacterium]